MPGIDGMEMCRRLDRFRNTGAAWFPLLMITGHDTKEDMMRALEAGADDFVSKSSDISILKARIRSLLRRKLQRDEHERIVRQRREVDGGGDGIGQVAGDQQQRDQAGREIDQGADTPHVPPQGTPERYLAAPAGEHEIGDGGAARGRGSRQGRSPLGHGRSEEHTSELQSLMRISYAVFCLKNT